MWTLNNYTDEEVALIKAMPCRYMSVGYEVGEGGTPHLQGMTTFSSPKTLTAAIACFPRRVSNVQAIIKLHEAIEYTQKEGNFFEEGSRPATQQSKGIAEKERWEAARTLAKAGRIEELDPDIYFRFYRTAKEIAKDHMVRPASIPELDNEWICGPTGCGKTRGVMERYPDCYLKTTNKWWDGYQGEETVLIDDIDEAHKCLSHHLKIWGDHKPFLAETKGGMIMIRPRRIIVTSNCRLSEFSTGVHLTALERRYRVTDHFPEGYQTNFNAFNREINEF